MIMFILDLSVISWRAASCLLILDDDDDDDDDDDRPPAYHILSLFITF